jgi:hypothetical protein
MSEDTSTKHQASYPVARRSTRVTIDISVIMFGQTCDGKVFREPTKTIRVNAHGGVVYLKADVDLQKPAILINETTSAQAHCRIANRAENAKGQIEVGFEFATPSPKFWGINFPPEDWNPAERKQHVRVPNRGALSGGKK